MYPKCFILVVAASLLFALHGCGGSSNGISGSVVFDGRSVANGSITFIPEDGKGPTAGGPISEGRYRIDNITPGRKMVQIVSAKKGNVFHSREEILQAAKTRSQQGAVSGIIDRADEIPANAEGNNSIVDVQPGQTEWNFDLKRPAVPRGAAQK
jgi:hypothetical protein